MKGFNSACKKLQKQISDNFPPMLVIETKQNNFPVSSLLVLFNTL